MGLGVGVGVGVGIGVEVGLVGPTCSSCSALETRRAAEFTWLG